MKIEISEKEVKRAVLEKIAKEFDVLESIGYFRDELSNIAREMTKERVEKELRNLNLLRMIREELRNIISEIAERVVRDEVVRRFS